MLNCILNEVVPLHATQAQGGSRGIAFPILDPGTRRGLVVSSRPLLLYPGEIDPVHIVQESGWVRKILPHQGSYPRPPSL